MVKILTTLLIATTLSTLYFFTQNLEQKKEFDNYARMINGLTMQKALSLYSMTNTDTNFDNVKKSAKWDLKSNFYAIEYDGLDYVLGKGNKGKTITDDNGAIIGINSGEDNLKIVCIEYNSISKIIQEDYSKKFPKTIKALNISCKQYTRNSVTYKDMISSM